MLSRLKILSTTKKQKVGLFAYHLEGLRVPLVVRVPQFGNHCHTRYLIVSLKKPGSVIDCHVINYPVIKYPVMKSVPSPRGGFGGLRPLHKAPRPPNWNV